MRRRKFVRLAVAPGMFHMELVIDIDIEGNRFCF